MFLPHITSIHNQNQDSIVQANEYKDNCEK